MRYHEIENFAPNGQPSLLSRQNWMYVRTPEFKSWFGDWENNPTGSSHVMDQNGEPLLVFHGTSVEFSAFDKKKAGAGNDKGLRGRGFYFSPNKATAASYGGVTMECFLNIRKPLIPESHDHASLMNALDPHGDYETDDHDSFYTMDGDYFKVSSRYVDTVTSMIRGGHDGVIYLARQEIVVFEPNQIRVVK